MGVCIEGEACGEVTQHPGYRLNIHTVLEGTGCEGVAEVVESYFRNTRSLQHSLEHIVHAVRGDGTAVGGGEHILVVGFGFLLLENFYCLL